ncbi:hypothetical protein AQI95_35130 [Streptomyces yokosukanensis]|uniref:DUF4097 domain-containing protein n=1 Tax=Streptomyces yokosukanensis TaxID=67386 RepID=A0A124HEB9_9ACTN|nr:DUF4097 family beta strand repeat-containing protein [Streptomyces yokosukanensis]KUN00252.1 hypothetical protein AQI95_35130 [Streptomyces yokosukanensis]
MHKNQNATQTFDTPAPVTARLDIPAGQIRLIAADRVDTTVEVLPTNAAKSRDIKAAEEITVTYGDGILRIETPEAKNRILGNSGSVQVTVQLPVGSRVEAKTAAAELRSTGRLGDVTFEGAQATVDLDESADTRLTLQAGDVSVGRLTGPAEVSTQNGDIRITQALQGTVTLRTQHGNITIGAAHSVSATLDADTAYGRIHNTLNNSAGAAAGLNIHATTSHGDITAQSL